MLRLKNLKKKKEPVVETVREDEPTFVLQFEVKATREDLRKLSEFLKVNNYEYKKIIGGKKMNNQLVKRNQNTFSNFIGQDAIKKKINSIVGGDKGQTFITAMVSAVSSNPALAKCDNSTILSAALVGESLG